MNSAVDLHLVPPEEVDDAGRHDGTPGQKAEQRNGPLAQQMGHASGIGHGSRPLEAPFGRCRSTSRPRDCSTERVTATRGSSCCARWSRRASPSTSCARRRRTTGWRCSRSSACSPARAPCTPGRSWPSRPASASDLLDEAARALGMPVRGPGERAITEEEMELVAAAPRCCSTPAFAKESFLELTSVMSRAMASIAATFTSVFGEALLQPGDTERDLGLRYAETLRNLGPLAAPDARADVQPAPARADARGGHQPGRAPERPAGGRAAGHRRLRGHRRLHQARRGRGPGGRGRRGAALRARGRRTPSSRPSGS